MIPTPLTTCWGFPICPDTLLKTIAQIMSLTARPGSNQVPVNHILLGIMENTKGTSSTHTACYQSCGVQKGLVTFLDDKVHFAFSSAFTIKPRDDQTQNSERAKDAVTEAVIVLRLECHMALSHLSQQGADDVYFTLV